jgi:hypothetical protein
VCCISLKFYSGRHVTKIPIKVLTSITSEEVIRIELFPKNLKADAGKLTMVFKYIL